MVEPKPTMGQSIHKPFDVSFKLLVRFDPQAWAELAGVATTVLEVVDTDLSTIVSQADKVLRMAEPNPYLLHLEFQSGYDAGLPARAAFYAAVLRWNHSLPVRTFIFLLRREADGAAMTGLVSDSHGPQHQDFHWSYGYRVIRLWQQPVSTLLQGGLATLPLAVVADSSKADLHDVVSAIYARIRREAPAKLEPELWAATFLLLGLRCEPVEVEALLKGVSGMEESSTYQVLIARGKIEGKAEGKIEGNVDEARKVLLRQAQRRFGELSPELVEKVATLPLDRLERLLDRILDATSLEDLFQDA